MSSSGAVQTTWEQWISLLPRQCWHWAIETRHGRTRRLQWISAYAWVIGLGSGGRVRFSPELGPAPGEFSGPHKPEKSPP